MYSKILVYQYGKVASTTIRCNGNFNYFPDVCIDYDTFIIQTHSHFVAKDVINKYKNIQK